VARRVRPALPGALGFGMLLLEGHNSSYSDNPLDRTAGVSISIFIDILPVDGKLRARPMDSYAPKSRPVVAQWPKRSPGPVRCTGRLATDSRLPAKIAGEVGSSWMPPAKAIP
jgi:hypothetical protein